MSIQITDNVFWVGITDWELRKFHGDEYSTHMGSSYNAYLIRGEKNVLVDTVWAPFSDVFVSKLSELIDLNDIDTVVINHAEIDHAGALPVLMRHIPDTPIVCSKKGIETIQGHYHQNWNLQVVNTGSKIPAGDSELIFVEASMLHWPDSMACYFTSDQILFSNDAFGQHFASDRLFNDEVDQAALIREAMKYYANILTPFSQLVTKKINEILAFNLPLSMICPSHGIIWREDPTQIIRHYLDWADGYQENQITIVYDTMWESTRQMAEAIASGLRQADNEVTIKLFNLAKSDKNDVVTEVFKSKAIIVGSPTINNGILVSVAGFLEQVQGLRFRGKHGAAFGSYGWSGEATRRIKDSLLSAGFKVANDGLRLKWNPNKEAIEECEAFGSGLLSEITNSSEPVH